MINPLPDIIVVRPISEQEQVSSTGFAVVKIDKDKPSKGVVYAVGQTTLVNVGDKIIYKKWASQQIHHNGEIFELVKKEDVLATYE